ncbi:MAG: acylphosphatase [Anaerolineales bacterium]|nr:acylphosphatase [Anaerolineales bacterium]
MRQSHSSESARIHVWVNGRVQAVGFRAFVEQVAFRLGLNGWVRNVGDDEVETVAEGHRSALEHFLEEVRRGPRASHVDEVRVEWEEEKEGFRTFEVRHSL